WQDVKAAIARVGNRESLQGVIRLKFDILIRFIALISAYSIFTNISAGMGTNLLAENGLLLQIALLSQFTIQGVGMTTHTLIANFNGKKEYQKMLPLLAIAIATSLVIALSFAISVLLFPQTIFNLLTNHADINQEIVNYTIWLSPLLAFTAVAFMLEGYFIGLTEGAVLRNASLISFFLVFLPLIAVTLSLQSVNLLWFSLTSYMLSLILVLGFQLFTSQKNFEFTKLTEADSSIIS
ncbi:MAG: MATE family efflux transporter, partial [Cyanobacteria bacterium P01_G01_bin.19]